MKHLNEAKEAKYDEFYTQYIDIENEAPQYIDYFKSQIIYMNCDDPDHSQFWKYFKDNFERFKLKKIISTFKSDNPYKTEFDGTKETKTKLEGGGDFRSPECLAILDEADLIITNPPFSCWASYYQTIRHKKFLILGTILKAGISPVFEDIKNSKTFLGTHQPQEFEVGENYSKFDREENGKRYKKVACCWFQNIERQPKRSLFQKQKPQKLDHTNIYNFDSVADIDLKYETIAAPITIFHYDFEKYYRVKTKLKGSVNNQAKFQRVILERKKSSQNWNK